MSEFPNWFLGALGEMGVHEVGENRGPDIRRFIALAHCGAEGDPWCAIFANAMLEQSGVAGTRSAMARSFEHHRNFVKLANPAYGCVVTFWRKSHNSGLGHVGFYNGHSAPHLISTVGGNEGDRVADQSYFADSATFGLGGYYWPAGIALPSLAAKTLPRIAHSHAASLKPSSKVV